jgi:NADPH:quinone reductase-like Zn-dependent oxidoreductase
VKNVKTLTRLNSATLHDDGQGAFSSVVIAKAHIAARIDSDLSFADASTLGVGITTVGQALYQALGLRLPPAVVEEPTSILIYGASTATGTLAVQFAKLGGLKVYATASPRNFDLLKSLGADEVFDYNDPECGSKIRAASNDSLYLVLDNISEHNSPDICAAAISSAGGRYTGLRSNGQFPRADVFATFTMGYTAIGQEFSKMYPRNQSDVEFATRFWKVSQDLINEGKIKPHPAEVREGGLQAIPQGLADLKEGRVSGAKLVYTLD